MNGFSKATISMERVGLSIGDGFKTLSFDTHINFGKNVSRYARINSLKELVYTTDVFNKVLNFFKNSECFFYVEVDVNDDIYKFFVASEAAFIKIKLSENKDENLYRQIEFTDKVIANRLKKEELRGIEYYINLKEKAEYEFERDLRDWK